MSNSPNGEIVARPAVIRLFDSHSQSVDASNDAAVLAGGARDTGELKDWLQMLGLLPAPVFWMGGDRS